MMNQSQPENDDWDWIDLDTGSTHDNVTDSASSCDDASVEGRTRTSSESSSSSHSSNESFPSTPECSERNLKALDIAELQKCVQQQTVENKSEIQCDSRPSQETGSSIMRKLMLALMIPLVAAGATALWHPSLTFEGEDSIYIPGLGFSGFWHTLGRLKSIDNPATKHYVCFSAGCLGAVTILNGFNVDEMACMATSAQSAWKNGEISRYDVVSEFVDGLVYRNFPRNHDCLEDSSESENENTQYVPINDPELFSRLHILTSTRSSLFGMKAVMRSPTNLDELREMLIQTTWIPGATGYGFHRNDHLDGGFSMLQHPKCNKTVNLPLDADVWLNSLNVNMGVDKAYRLWDDGLAYGI